MVDVNLKVPALEKLADYAASGIGAVAGPMLATWKARQDAKARLIGVEAEADSLRMIASAQADARRALVAPDETGGGMLDIGPAGIAQRVEFQERKRQANIASVVRDAAANLGDREVPDHQPDPDWTARFFDCVQDVSSGDMRKLWAKLLSGEVEEPGRASLRTLDILRNMTKRDAQIFASACSFVISDFIYYPNKYQSEFQELSLRNIMHLESIGLLNGHSLVTRRLEIIDNVEYFPYHNQKNILKISSKENSKTIQIPAIPITDSGQELCRVVDSAFREDYLKSFSVFLRKNNCEVSYARVIKIHPDGSIAHTQPFVPIGPEPERPEGAAP